jgi:hypothetical protein
MFEMIAATKDLREFGDLTALEVVGGAEEGNVIGIGGGQVAAPELDEVLAARVPDGEAELGSVVEGGHAQRSTVCRDKTFCAPTFPQRGARPGP